MLKTLSVFVLAALFIVGCSSEDEAKKKRNFKETVYAFMNSNPRIAGYGHLDVGAIMKDGKVESNEAFKMFASQEFSEIKEQLDIKSPVYFAMEAPESGEAVVYVLAKLKNQEKFVEDWTESGYMFKEAGDITYTEDGDFLWGMRNETVILVVTPGQYEAEKVISEAFKFTEGDMAKGALKKELDKQGDMVMHFDVERMAANEDNPGIDITGLEADISLNFDKGKMVLEATSNKTEEMKKELGMEMSDEPILAKKVTDGEGNLVLAMQMRMSNPMMGMALGNDLIMDEAMSEVASEISMIDASLTISDLEEADGIIMPETGKAIGGQPLEVLVKIDAMASMIPEYEEYLSKLDYATYEVRDDSMRFVIAAKDTNENFLATILKVVEEFVMSGKWMELAMQ